MLNFQVCISFALLVAVFGNPAPPEGNEFTKGIAQRCDKFTPVVVTPEQAHGEWYGVEMVKNIGIGKHLDDSKKTCLYGGAKSVNSTRYFIDQKMIAGEDFDHDKTFNADLNPQTGVVTLEGYPGEELRVIAVKDNKFLALAYCGIRGNLDFLPITKVVIFRRPGTTDYSPNEEKEFHDEIKTKLQVDKLVFGKLHCREHGKN